MKTIASIIIRTHNEEDWIGHCLSAIKKQKFSNFEIIVVDNCSTDNTIKIVKSFDVKKIIKIKKFIPGKALNLGCEKASGKFLVFLSAHCVPEKDTWLTNLIGNFKNKKVAAVYGKQSPIKFSKAEDIRDLYITFGNEKKIQKKDYFFHNANSAIRKSLWKKYKFSNTLTNIEDRDWSKKIINLKHWIIYEPKSNVFHHHGIHHGSNIERLKKTINVIEEIESNNFLKIPDTLKPENIKLLVVLNYSNYKNKDLYNNIFNKIIKELGTLNVNKRNIFIKPIKFNEKFIPKDYLIIKSSKKLELTKILKMSVKKIINKNFFPDYVLYLNADYVFRPKNLIKKIINQICISGYDTVIPSHKSFSTSFLFNKKNSNFEIYGKELTNRSKKKPIYTGFYGLGSIVKTKIASKGFLSSEKENGLYEIKNKLETLRISELDNRLFKSVIKLK